MAWTNLYDGTKISASFKVSSRKARRPFSLPVWFMLIHNKEPLETRAARYASAFGFGVPYETFLVWLLQLWKISCLFSETSNKKSLSQWVLRCKGKKKKKNWFLSCPLVSPLLLILLFPSCFLFQGEAGTAPFSLPSSASRDSINSTRKSLAGNVSKTFT